MDYTKHTRGLIEAIKELRSQNREILLRNVMLEARVQALEKAMKQ